MPSARKICSLSYLIGTLSTAYKGVITSLVAKDFCMGEEGNSTTLKATILSMPEGTYEASLIRRGTELARNKIDHGSFELQASRDQVKEAKDLQIDILQTGRHIGTFLLKKETAEEIYISATELSDELKGINFNQLTIALREKIGLQQKAEKIITRILSPKKDWLAFSGLLHGFAGDLFWSARDVFYGSFDILVRFSLKAAERCDPGVTTKPVANFLDIIALPLEHETDDRNVRSAADTWLQESSRSNIGLSQELGAALRILSSINTRFHDLTPAPLIKNLLESVTKKIIAQPVLPPAALHALEYASHDDYAALAQYSEGGQRGLLGMLSEAEQNLEKGYFKKVLEFLNTLNAGLFDDGKLIALFCGTLTRHMSADTADAFVTGLIALFSHFAGLSQRGVDAVKANVPPVIDKLVSCGRTDASRSLLAHLGNIDSAIKEEIVMNREVAAAVLRSGDGPLLSDYRALLKQIVIPRPNVREISSETWAEVVHPLHLDRLTKFMNILQLGNLHFREILVHVIANLYLSGVFIPDDRLFQRVVSAYLNSEAARDDFFLNYLFLQRLPVYYNEVGAVSRTRDYSTEIDSWGNDPALYFVRKQVHVNASNHNVRLLQKLIASWVYNDPSLIREVVAEDVYAGLKREFFDQYSRAIKPFFESLGVLDVHGLHLKKLLGISEDELREKADKQKVPREISTKIFLLSRLYQEVVKKYSSLPPDVKHGDISVALEEYAEQEKGLKQIILAEEKTAAKESLYFKRHIAFGIPSVLGTYHERKFDAFGEFLRVDGRIRLLFEELITTIEAREHDFSAKEAGSWVQALATGYRVLRLHGLENVELEESATVATENKLRLSQIYDVLRMWQKELAWIVETVNRTFHKSLTDILIRYPKEDLPEYLMNLNHDAPDFTDKAADIVIRDIINNIPGMVEADRAIERLRIAFASRIDFKDEFINVGKPEERRNSFSLFDLSDREIMKLGPLLGDKAKNLAFLYNRGFRIPAGVVFSSSLTHAYPAFIDSPEFTALLREGVSQIEKKTDRIFGDPERPLLLSVRSGSYVSMPGILSSILYCGMNPETVRALSKTKVGPRVAWDSYRRFIEHYGSIVFGLDLRIFEKIMYDVMQKSGRSGLDEADVRDLEAIVELYREELSRRGLVIPVHAYEQLRESVRAVYASWFGEKARQFRRATQTSEYWGTAVTLMEMVPANAPGSGASMFFTRNPLTHERQVYGETRKGATGDELAYGRHLNIPLARIQNAGTQEMMKNAWKNDSARHRIRSLEESDPDLYRLHQELALNIEDAMGGLPQEVEATYTRQNDGRTSLFVLQTRMMEFGADYRETFNEICNMESHIIGRGIGAHGGALSGVASFTDKPEEADRLSRIHGLPVILMRTTATTDDVSLMTEIGGIITASGGVTSHAAVLARKFGVTAVVGCTGMSLGTDQSGEVFARIGDDRIREGTQISIDGSTGLVFSGICLLTQKIGKWS